MDVTATSIGAVRIERIGRVNLAYTRKSLSESKEFAKAQGGRLLLQSEIIGEIIKNPELFKVLEGKRAYLGGKPSAEPSGTCKLDGEKGDLSPTTHEEWNVLPSDKKASFWKGDRSLSMSVLPEGGFYGRVAFYGDGDPDVAADVVIYVLEDQPASV